MRRINRISTVSAVSGASIILCWQMRDTQKTQKINVHSPPPATACSCFAKYLYVLTFVRLFCFSISCSLSLEQNFQFNLTSSWVNNFARKVGIQSHSLHDTLETSQYNFAHISSTNFVLKAEYIKELWNFSTNMYNLANGSKMYENTVAEYRSLDLCTTLQTAQLCTEHCATFHHFSPLYTTLHNLR